MILKKIALSKKELAQWTANYGIAGAHSAVQICTWTKKAIRGKGVCYKQKFYGIDCHRCAQISPAFAWCQENCVFCWRPNEWMKKIKMKKSEVDQPKEIIFEILKQRKRLLSGLKGAYDVKTEKWSQSFELFPSHWAISLSGEPTIYPKLDELIKELRKNKEVKSIFLVSNGQEPKAIEKLKKENALPTQLYISVDACNKKMFEKINKPKYKDGWKRLNKTLKLLYTLPCRTVIRCTLIKGVNDSEIFAKNFAELFEKTKADFIELKSYMFLGSSRNRLVFENMPSHEHIRNYAKQIEKFMPNYSIINEDSASRIVLFKNKNSKYENIITKSIIRKLSAR